jgi:hypothetical protein
MYFQAFIFVNALGSLNRLALDQLQKGCPTVPAIIDYIEDYRLLPKPWWLRMGTKEWQWVTIDPKIYHPPHIDPLSRPAIIQHEKVHIAQQRRMGKCRWIVRYAVSKRFRLDQELEPIIVELSNTPRDARQRLAAVYARNLAGSPYSRAAKSEDMAWDAIQAKAAEMGVELQAAGGE